MISPHQPPDPNQLKIGFFTDDFFPYRGGMGRYVHEVTTRLPLPLLVFSPTDSQLPFHVKVSPPLGNYLRNISYSIFLNLYLPRFIARHELTVINLQCGPGGLFLLKNPGLPVVATCHHTWWQQANYIREQRWKRIFIPLERRTYNIATQIICDAIDTKKILMEKYGINDDKICVIPLGVNRDTFHPIMDTPREKDSLLFVGRLDRRKGIDFLLQALTLVQRQIPGVRLYIASRGSMPSHPKEQILKNNLQDNVIHLGFVGDNELNTWYNKVDCCVVPSVFEGFGLTAVEAMAAGTAVIATDVDGLRCIIQNEKNGLLAEYGAPESLAACIIRLLRNDTLRARLTGQGTLDAQINYNWNSAISNMVNLFENIQ